MKTGGARHAETVRGRGDHGRIPRPVRGMRAGPLAALRSVEAEASRGVARRLGESPPRGRRLGALLAARPALAPVAVPHSWRRGSMLLRYPPTRRLGAEVESDPVPPALVRKVFDRGIPLV